MKRNAWLSLIVISSALFFSSCNDDEPYDPYAQLRSDIQTIDNYISSNGISPVIKDARGVRMHIKELGTKLPAYINNTVDVDYKGMLLSDGSVFDQGNTRQPLEKYIDGWKIAFTTLPAGSKATLYVPSSYAYGQDPQQGIPANSILVFDVHFKEVVLTSAEQQRLIADTTAIEKYLDEKAVVNYTTDDSGIRYVITEQGSGQIPSLYNKLKAKFTYRLLTDDSKVVAELTQQPSDDYENRVVDQIHGLKIGLQKIAVGSKVRFYIPSGLAFGANGAQNGGQQVIPANANIIVDVELTEVVQ